MKNTSLLTLLSFLLFSNIIFAQSPTTLAGKSKYMITKTITSAKYKADGWGTMPSSSSPSQGIPDNTRYYKTVSASIMIYGLIIYNKNGIAWLEEMTMPVSWLTSQVKENNKYIKTGEFSWYAYKDGKRIDIEIRDVNNKTFKINYSRLDLMDK